MGGDMNWIKKNTCTIRATMALNAIGVDVGRISNARWKDGKDNRYLIRVKEMNQFLRAYYGAPTWVGGPGHKSGKKDTKGQDIFDHPKAIEGKAGIIRYSDCKFKDASGHIDIWDGYRCKGHDQIEKCNKVEVWDVCNPKANPDFTALWAHMKETKGWDSKRQPSVASAEGGAGAATPRTMSKTEQIKQAQTSLNALAAALGNPKLNVGTPDGKTGRKTRHGV
jgi:hypothetical protein